MTSEPPALSDPNGKSAKTRMVPTRNRSRNHAISLAAAAWGIRWFGPDMVNLEFDELVSVAWIAATAARSTHDPARGTLDRWARTCAYWAVRQHVEQDAARVPNFSTGPTDPAERICARIDVERALGRMTDQQRYVWTRWAAGWRQRELAAALGVTQGRVSQIKTEALRNARRA